MSRLPVGWTTARVEELGALKLGKMLDKAKNQGRATRYLRNINVRWFRFDLKDMHTISVAPEEMRQLAVRDGDLFICEGGEPGRCAVWRGGDNAFVYQKALHRFRSSGAMEPELLMFRLRLDAETGALSKFFTGTTIKHLTGEGLARFEVPVPPLPEQKRIAGKLDALLARMDACRQRLDRVPTILKRFRQSVLAAATSGELTREWREERCDDRGAASWTPCTLSSLCAESRIITYGVIKLGTETPKGIPCLRTSNVRWLHVDTEGMKRIAPTLSAAYGRTVLQGGELLVNVRGTLGGVAVAGGTMRGWNVSREIAVVPVDSRVVRPKYIAFWVGSDRSQRWLSGVERGVAYTGINIEDLRALPVSVPPLDEQDEIVRRVEELFQFANRVESQHRAAARPVVTLAQALLAKAFRGELVPQDPNDEPASALLERIRIHAASVAETNKWKRSRRPAPLRPTGAPGTADVPVPRTPLRTGRGGGPKVAVAAGRK